MDKLDIMDFLQEIADQIADEIDVSHPQVDLMRERTCIEQAIEIVNKRG